MKFGDDLGADEETALAADLEQPLIVSRFPTAIKSFYMQPDPEDPEVVLGLDMLAPEGYGEIIGGSQRIHDLTLLEKRLEEHKLPRERTSGTWTSAATARSRTPASAWASSASSRGSAESITCAKRSRIRGP